MLVIGLTGGIGTGKSEAARQLEELGALIISADQVGHEAYTVNTEAWEQVVATFGNGILQDCLLYTSPSPRDLSTARMPSSA